MMSSLVNNKKIKLVITIVLLAAIYLGAAFYRIRVGTNREFYDPRDPTAFYWTENALQYHYADLVSRGRPIPAFDPKLQAPEGVKVFENLTILMEYPNGALYRWLDLGRRGIRFHTFTIYFMAFFSALTAFALYFGARALGLGRLSALLAAALGSFSYVSIGRSIQGFLNEDLSLPLFFIGLALFLQAVRCDRRRVWSSLAAGGCFAVSLAGWHLSLFLFLGLVAAAVINLFFFTPPAESRPAAKTLLFTALIPWCASLVVPVLRSRGYFLSPAFGLAFGAAAGVLLIPGSGSRPAARPGRGWLRIAPALGGLVLTLILAGRFNLEAEYGHVWSLFFWKLRLLGVKPADPALIPPSARSLWIEAFNSPSGRMLVAQFFPLFIAAVAGSVAFFRHRRRDWSARLFLILAGIFLLLYLGIERMSVVFNFFAAVLAAGIGLWALGRGGKQRAVLPAVLAMILAFNFYQGIRLHEGTGYFRFLDRVFGTPRMVFTNNRVNDLDLVYYVRNATPAGSIFLSRYSVGPLLLTYAGRPIALQPKFEVQGCQGRVADYYRCMYGTEDDLYDLCRRWRIGYLLYDTRILLDAGRDSDRWVADRLTLGMSTAAFRLHFAPESLRHYQLVYQNSAYRLFRVLPPDTPAVPAILPDQPVYDLPQFGGQALGGRPFDDRWDVVVPDRIRAAFGLVRAAQSVLVQDPARAARLAEEARRRYPGLTGSAAILGVAYCLLGRVEEGHALCRQEADERPYFPLAHYNLAYALIRLERYDEARAELDRTLELDPGFEGAREMRRELGAPGR